MKILVTCRSATSSPRSGVRSTGFTLLELLVVLAIMAAMTSLALPQLSKLYESGQRRIARNELLDALAALPHTAHMKQAGFVLKAMPGQHEVPLQLPAGWSLKSASSGGIVYRATGFCTGGSVTISSGEFSEELVLEAPFCEPWSR